MPKRLYRFLWPVVVILVALVFPAMQAAPLSASAAAVTIMPAGDAYVNSSSPDTNYGTNTTLRVDGSPDVRSYLLFNLSGQTGTITQARLRFYANSATSSGISVRPLGDAAWSETTITYSNAPSPGSVFATTGAVTANTWKELDVTGLIAGNGLLNIALTTSGSTAISLASRESGGNAPQLVITTGQPAPSGTPSRTATLPSGQTATPTLPITSTPTPTRTSTALPYEQTPAPVVILAAGDIAKCKGGTPSPTNGAMITSNMLLNTTETIFSLGDNSNDDGSADDYYNCYDPTWGRLQSRVIPVMGNHDKIADPQGAPYFDHFGAKAHPETYGHFSLNMGAWHIVVLNAECSVGKQGCGAGSPQEQWLRADLAAYQQNCILAIWHQPLFTSGTQSPTAGMLAFWKALYDYRADVLLNSHNHNYERFVPQDPNANPVANGIREFVVGTGGASRDSSSLPLAANEEVRSAAAYGYLKLTLRANSYDWQFIAQPGKTFTDSGSGTCH